MARTYAESVTTPAAAAALGNRRPFVSLLSDFGTRDPSAGIMRAVVTGICRDVNVVDLAHEVDKFAVRDGALLLWSAVPYLPVGAHVAVVDPGVGTSRQGIALQTQRGDYLVGPDNGLLMPAAARLGGITKAHALENPRFRLSPVSASFHGRDIFAPAAAHLADRTPIEDLGRMVDPRMLVELDWPRPDIRPGAVRSSVVYVDTFGNVKLSALESDVHQALPNLRINEPLIVRVTRGGETREINVVWATTFGSVAEGAPLLFPDSYGRACLAIHQGSAADRFDLEEDVEISVLRPSQAVRSPQPPRPSGPPRPSAPRPSAPPPPPRRGAPPPSPPPLSSPVGPPAAFGPPMLNMSRASRF